MQCCDTGPGCFRKHPPCDEGEGDANPTLVRYFPKKCQSGLFYPRLLGNGLVSVHQVLTRAKYFITCTSGKVSKFCQEVSRGLQLD